MHKITLLLITILAASGILLSACNSNGTPADLAGTSWKLVSYGPADSQTPAAAGVETSLNFDKDGQVNGNLGCNEFAGDYSLKDGKIIFGMLAATEMACPDPQMTQESTAYQVMNGTVLYEVKGETLIIYAADKTVAITLSRK